MYNDTVFLFIGGYFSKEDEQEILNYSKLPMQYAANEFQKRLIYGFDKKIPPAHFEKVSAPFIGAYPMGYKKKFFKSSTNSEEFVDFINIFAIKNIFRTKNLKKNLKRSFLKKIPDSNQEIVVFVYSPHNPFLEAAIYLKNKFSNVHICLIVPDLPQFMDLSNKQSKLYRALKKIDLKKFYKNLNYVDSYVLLTKEMKNVLPILDNYTIVEGIVDTEISKTVEVEEIKFEKNSYILYTGTLNEKFGIIDLVDSFLAVENKNGVKLVIAGKGDSENLIKNADTVNDSIVYLGQVSNEESKYLQKNALFLINPRNNKEEFTKYSFPSKNMEYLSSGRPVVCFKLEGIPEEYDSIFEYVNSTMEKKIRDMLNLEKNVLDDIGKKGQDFVLSNKNVDIQCEKILKLIEGVASNV